MNEAMDIHTVWILQVSMVVMHEAQQLGDWALQRWPQKHEE